MNKNRYTRPDGTRSAKVIQVIETRSIRGLGTEKDPAREVVQYWDFEGNFLAELDREYSVPIIMHESKAIEDSITSDLKEAFGPPEPLNRK